MTNPFQRRSGYWILKDRIPMPCMDLMTWALAMQESERQIAFTEIDEELHVSTIFLGLDVQYSLDPDAPPILFESVAFGERTTIEYPDGRFIEVRETLEQRRYSTYAEAQQGHEEMCQRMRERFALALSHILPEKTE
jgi:hypothetical protein